MNQASSQNSCVINPLFCTCIPIIFLHFSYAYAFGVLHNLFISVQIRVIFYYILGSELNSRELRLLKRNEPQSHKKVYKIIYWLKKAQDKIPLTSIMVVHLSDRKQDSVKQNSLWLLCEFIHTNIKARVRMS